MSKASPFDVTLASTCAPCGKDRTTFCCDGTPQISPFPVLHVSHMLWGGKFQVHVHARCGYAGKKDTIASLALLCWQ